MELQDREGFRGFPLPRFPKIPERYNLIQVQEGEYRLYSLLKSLTLRERTDTQLFPRLLPLLNGQYALEEILQQLPEFDPETLIKVLIQFKDQGILEDAIKITP